MSNFDKKMLSIQQVSLITGLSKAVIRKWEDRYHTVTPERLNNGHRIYTERDVQILLAVRKLVDQGSSIQQATIEAQAQVQNQHEQMPSVTNTLCTSPIHEEYCYRLLEYGTTCDVLAIQRILQEAHQKFGLERFLDEVVTPLLWEIGERWEKNRWNPFQESVSSTVIRDYLVGLRNQMHIPADAPLLMGACLPGEVHDLPLCILLLKAQLRGYRVYLISSSPAPGSIEQLITYFNPQIVLLSAMSELPFTTYPDVLPNLDIFAANNPEVQIFIGGIGATEYLKTNKLQAIQYLKNIENIYQR